MRQCENIFVFIDLTKSIGSDLGGAVPTGLPGWLPGTLQQKSNANDQLNVILQSPLIQIFDLLTKNLPQEVPTKTPKKYGK